MAEKLLCDVHWCIAPRAWGSDFCAVHKAEPRYDPGPGKGSLKKIWDRVPVETSAPVKPKEAEETPE